jgi:hypothetical protein
MTWVPTHVHISDRIHRAIEPGLPLNCVNISRSAGDPGGVGKRLPQVEADTNQMR